MREPGSGAEADNAEAFDQMDVDKAKAAAGVRGDSSVGLGTRNGDLDGDEDEPRRAARQRTEESDPDAPEPSLQQHHDPETEADTASGGSPDE